MKYKLIAIDLDDTLLNASCEISERNREAIRSAKEKGIKIILCTGRPLSSSERYYRELGLDTPMVNFGGGVINLPGKGEIRSTNLSNEDTHKIIKFADDLGIYWQVYIDDEYSYPKACPESEFYGSFFGGHGMEVPYLRKMEIHTPKVLFIIEPTNVARVLSRTKEAFPHLNVTTSKAQYVEIMKMEVTKGAAIKYLAESYGLDPSEVMAIGDSPIDISMMEYAGLGVAVASGTDQTRAAADYIAPSNLEDGVAFAIERFAL